MNFRVFLENVESLPDIMTWIRSFFANRMDKRTLAIYGDFLSDKGMEEIGNFFRFVSDNWHDPRKKTGGWHSHMLALFNNYFGWRDTSNYEFNDRLAGSLLIVPESPQMSRHIIHPGMTSYRLSLTNGQWFIYTNQSEQRVSVVSTRHQPTPQSERWFPPNTINIRNYKPISVQEVPDEVLFSTFLRIIEKQIRS